MPKQVCHHHIKTRSQSWMLPALTKQVLQSWGISCFHKAGFQSNESPASPRHVSQAGNFPALAKQILQSREFSCLGEAGFSKQEIPCFGKAGFPRLPKAGFSQNFTLGPAKQVFLYTQSMFPDSQSRFLLPKAGFPIAPRRFFLQRTCLSMFFFDLKTCFEEPA